MKRAEIIQRQDRIVYILLVLTATLGLVWVLWRHQHLHLLAHDGPAAPATFRRAPR